MKRAILLAFLLAGTAACNQQADTKKADAAAKTLADANAATATNLDNVDLNDTTEDPAYASAGEDLAKENAGLLGTPAPAAVLKSIDGSTVDLTKTYGKKPVYLKFWATWCVPCRQQMPAFQRDYEKLKDKMEFVAINVGLSDDEASIRKFESKYGMTMPVVMDKDGQLAKLFHLGVTPQHVIIGKDVRFAYFGHADNASLRQAIDKALSGAGTAAPATAQAVVQDRAFAVGDFVPALSAVSLTGQPVSFGGARPGRLRAVQFFASWCEWYLEKSRPATAQACARRRQEIEAIKAKMPGVEWLGIAGGPWATAQDLGDYRKNNTVTIPLALDKDGALFRAFGVRDLPTVALIDPSGRLVRLVGPNDTDLAAAIQKAAAAQPAGNRT
jgi:peroxiredoxin